MQIEGSFGVDHVGLQSVLGVASTWVDTRVSTEEQGRSGLGRRGTAARHRHFTSRFSEIAWEIVGEFCEIQSGKDDDRPELGSARPGEADRGLSEVPHGT